MRFTIPLLCLALAACTETTTTGGQVSKAPSINSTQMQRFSAVQSRVEPVAERECRARARSGVNCDFKIVIHPNADLPPNAYQSLEGRRPVVTFTQALLNDLQNSHEIAFVMGHEAAHHIENHIAKTQVNATAGSIFGALVGAAIGSQVAVDVGQQLGGSVGARAYSKDMELEADALGAVITHKAGYDPRAGAAYFFRSPDPGDRFLGSHPPNAERRATINRVAASL
ncbi:M48 family metalloprotease [Actibacterium pelagium]|uniref:Peptidase M48 n=1 Tax=Actibacterium pelagium TaxID=2029103 RepID=A0A917AEZ6_9RHOB|nr:M48 family metalloprotease [Actibacterium pelagium]GGE47839.1 peptidase M48 [Actibacterium pelagium]